MGLECQKSECTFSQTGLCLLNNDPSTCPERAESEAIDSAADVTPVLEEPVGKAKFPGSLSLTPRDTQQLMNEQYSHLIGIFGAPDAGKTALLVSLYLLLTQNRLEGFEFRNSQSIMAFEEIARGARRWSEAHPPEQMTSHTKLPDERSAGFMHLRMLNMSTGGPVDILMPDLPGEWSSSLIDSNRIDRLDFLKSVDSIWLMVNGRTLIAQKLRQLALHRTKRLMKRIAAFLDFDLPPVTLVITRHDFGTPARKTIEVLMKEADDLGISMNVINVASFADGGKADAGAGIADLISWTLKDRSSGTLPFWLDSQASGESRFALKFRDRGGNS